MFCNKDFKAGDLIIFKVIDRYETPEGLATGSRHYFNNNYSTDKMFLYEEISIDNFPSCNDFFGKKILVEEGDLGMIVRKVGKPFNVLSSTDNYDVYEVITYSGEICHAFKINLESIHKK